MYRGMRIVVKIGTRSLLDDRNMLSKDKLYDLVTQLVALKKAGHVVLLVSSGAVASGRAVLAEHPFMRSGKGKRLSSDPVTEKQALAAIGQARLIQTYNEALHAHGMVAAQLLFTKHDFQKRQQGVNIARLIEKLVTDPGLLPVVNENDSVAIEELVFTDNDELAGILAIQSGAERLIILTDVAGVLDDDGNVIPELSAKAAVNTNARRGTGRGGMDSKLKTARKMSRAGVQTHIAPAQDKDALMRLIEGESVGTVMKAQKKPTAVKRWLASESQLRRGWVMANACLVDVLNGPKAASILPVGLTRFEGAFQKGDVVDVTDEDGRRIAFGIARYNHEALAERIGQKGHKPFIHYDELHMIDTPPAP